MPSASALVASLALLGGMVALIAALAQLARRAHRADDLGDVTVPWGLVAAAVALEGLLAALRLFHYFTEASTSAFEVQLQAISGVAAAFLLVGFLRGTHRARTGKAPEGTLLAGLVLLGTSILSMFAITAGGNTILIHGALAIELGAWAWALSDLAYETREIGSPRWAISLAQGGAYVLVLGAYARAIANNGSDSVAVAQATRLVLAMTYFVAAAFALPAFAALAESVEPVKSPAASEPVSIAPPS